MLDLIVSHLPTPLMLIAVRLFMPKLWAILKAAQVTQQGDKTLLTWRGKGHIVITDERIEVLR